MLSHLCWVQASPGRLNPADMTTDMTTDKAAIFGLSTCPLERKNKAEAVAFIAHLKNLKREIDDYRIASANFMNLEASVRSPRFAIDVFRDSGPH
jgi:hypothetical protein